MSQYCYRIQLEYYYYVGKNVLKENYRKREKSQYLVHAVYVITSYVLRINDCNIYIYCLLTTIPSILWYDILV